MKTFAWDNLLQSYERDEWKGVNFLQEEVARYQTYAAAWLENNILVSLALPANDLEALKEKAKVAGTSYEVIIANLVHQFVTGKIEVKA